MLDKNFKSWRGAGELADKIIRNNLERPEGGPKGRWQDEVQGGG
jgi:hypothetical protein